ncbi:MAG: SIS domain-containing protein [Dehalococcoidales bacterium]|nr:MAG: SIS domain-containing protein [Dehalococcoidales bacterium]
MKNKQYIQNYLKETRDITKLVSVETVDKAIDLLFDAWKNGNHVYTCGNGGSASTATHFACDLVKTTTVAGKAGLKAECLNDNIPLVLALINDDGFENLFSEQLKVKAEKGDILICISVHGGSGRDKAGLWSQNLLKAITHIQKIGGKTIGLSGFDGGAMNEIADVSIVVPANSTPQVESFHLVLEHLICSCLSEKIMRC